MTPEEYRIQIKKLALKTQWDSIVTFKCEHCGKEVQMRSANVRKKKLLLCHSCQIKHSKSLRTEEQKIETHNKTVSTCMQRYGVPNGGCSEISKTKAIKTWTENWGSKEECFKQRTQKAHNTFLSKYRGTYSTPEINTKKAQTLIDKYGSIEESYKQRTEKAIRTNEKNHKGHHNFVDPEWRKYAKEKMIEHWGVEYFAQNKEEWHKICEKYGTLGGLSGTWKYDGKRFDSFWEIAFYVHLQENHIPFIFHPKGEYRYINDDGKEAYYNPDFLINGNLYEVKGDHFFNENGDPIDCRGNKWFNKLKYMEQLGVTLVTSKIIPVNTVSPIDDIASYIKECLTLKGNPSKYAFIKSCIVPKNKRSIKSKILYDIEEQIQSTSNT